MSIIVFARGSLLMHTFHADRDPETCSSMGLECHSCVEHSARSVAAICGGIATTALHSTFVQLYPSPMCRPMGPAFASAYVEASAPRKPAVRAFAA